MPIAYHQMIRLLVYNSIILDLLSSFDFQILTSKSLQKTLLQYVFLFLYGQQQKSLYILGVQREFNVLFCDTTAT